VSNDIELPKFRRIAKPSSSGSSPLILKMKVLQSLERRLLFTSLQRVTS